MKIFMILFIILASVCPTAYAQSGEQATPAATAPIDKDQLLNRLAILKPFQSEKGGAGLGYVFSVTKEEFRNSLILLSPEKADEVMKDFGMAVAFIQGQHAIFDPYPVERP